MCIFDSFVTFLLLPYSASVIFFQMANGAAGHRGLTAHALVGKVDRVELAPVVIKSLENLSRMAGVPENHNRKKHVLIGNAQVRVHLSSFVAG